jgi:TRAP-type C4-dicarboxylate transport system permease small subunit
MSSLEQGLATAAGTAAWREREAVLLEAALPGNDGTLMRRLLDFLYDGAAWLAALAMIGVLLMVLLSIVSRQVGFHVPGTDAYAGYSMAAAGFLALAHTLKRNEHIRVTLLLGKLGERGRHRLEMWALSAAVFLSGLFAFYSVRLAWVSRTINDMSTSSDATPLWIPQVAMAVGTVILFIAFVDDWVLELQGRRKQAGTEEALHHE